MPDYDAMERYVGRCVGVVVRLGGVVAPNDLDRAQHLIDHGEPAEGMRALAWAIVQSGASVPADVVRDIRELAADLIGPEDMPPTLDDHIG